MVHSVSDNTGSGVRCLVFSLILVSILGTNVLTGESRVTDSPKFSPTATLIIGMFPMQLVMVGSSDEIDRFATPAASVELVDVYKGLLSQLLVRDNDFLGTLP